MSTQKFVIDVDEFKKAVKYKILQGDNLSMALDSVFADLDENDKYVGKRVVHTYKGVSGTLRQLCTIFNVNYATVWNRINKGCSLEEAMSNNAKWSNLEYGGVRGSLRHICKTLGVNYATVWGRLNRGYTLEEAFSGKRHKPFVSRRFTGRQHTYKGVTGNLKYLCREFNFSYAKANQRLRKGFSIEDAFSEIDMRRNPKKRGKVITFKGYTGTLKDVCNHFGLNFSSVKSKKRLKGISTIDSLEHFYNKKNAK